MRLGQALLRVIRAHHGRVCGLSATGVRLGDAGRRGRWAAATWLFLVEPLGPWRCRVISRYRCESSRDLATRGRRQTAGVVMST